MQFILASKRGCKLLAVGLPRSKHCRLGQNKPAPLLFDKDVERADKRYTHSRLRQRKLQHFICWEQYFCGTTSRDVASVLRLPCVCVRERHEKREDLNFRAAEARGLCLPTRVVDKGPLALRAALTCQAGLKKGFLDCGCMCRVPIQTHEKMTDGACLHGSTQASQSSGFEGIKKKQRRPTSRTLGS